MKSDNSIKCIATKIVICIKRQINKIINIFFHCKIVRKIRYGFKEYELDALEKTFKKDIKKYNKAETEINCVLKRMKLDSIDKAEDMKKIVSKKRVKMYKREIELVYLGIIISVVMVGFSTIVSHPIPLNNKTSVTCSENTLSDNGIDNMENDIQDILSNIIVEWVLYILMGIAILILVLMIIEKRKNHLGIYILEEKYSELHKETEIKQLEDTVQEKEIEIKQLEDTVQEKEIEIKQLEDTVQKKEIAIKQLEDTVQERNKNPKNNPKNKKDKKKDKKKDNK